MGKPRHFGNKKSSSYEDYNSYDDYECDESISVYDAADIWLSSGKDEDYQCGYTVEELESVL